MKIHNYSRAFTLGVSNPRSYGNQQVRTVQTHARDDWFNYTSGRWIVNENLRLAERYLEFDVTALHRVIASATCRPASDIVSLFKSWEGGSNRIFEATFRDGHRVLARLPYPSIGPFFYAVASEAATMDYLRLNGINTPQIYDWSGSRSNPVGAEYIIMEKLTGNPLNETWYSLKPKEQHSVIEQLVEWEARLMALKFPASGSLYYTEDAPKEHCVPLPDQDGRKFCIGPMAHYAWWQDERSQLYIDRGPWESSRDLLQAVGERERTWATAHAKPRLPYERLYREIYNFNKIWPNIHIPNLGSYLKLSRHLGFKPGSALSRPVLRHPDFQPNNILISESHEITGLIDWQHSSVLPLGLAAGIPKHFQNYGDPVSERLDRPDTKLPPEFESLSPSEQDAARETSRRRVVHFLYAGLTKRANLEHYDAIFNQSAILHRRLLKSAGSPWKGDSVTLKADIIRTLRNWSTLITEDSVDHDQSPKDPPTRYSLDNIQETMRLDVQQKQADSVFQQMQDVLGVDELGWVPNDEYEDAKEIAREIKLEMIKAAQSNSDRVAARDHFPFDDFDEAGQLPEQRRS